MIEEIFRVRIDYEAYDVSRVENTFFDAISQADVSHVESFSGNPACAPYLIVECTKRQNALEIERKLKVIIKQNKGKIT